MKLYNRELSWLAFNERVLQESMDTRVPLVERMRFLGIFSNNQDEFFRVRVANIKRMMAIKSKSITGFDGSPAHLFDKINDIVTEQQTIFQKSYNRLLEELGKEGIHHLKPDEINDSQRRELYKFFNFQLKHSIVPIMLSKKSPFSGLRDSGVYLAVKMVFENAKKSRYALLQIPTDYTRFYTFSENGQHSIILIDDIIRIHLDSIFSIFTYDSVEAFTFKFTRDAELSLDDDISLSLLEKIEKSIKLRKKGDPVRFVYDSAMPEDMLHTLLDAMKLKNGSNVIAGGRYHNFKDFMNYPDFGIPNLVYKKRQALLHPQMENRKSLLKSVLHRDILLHYPYQQFDYVVDLIREAAIDPKVKSIRINLYRVTRNSTVMNALMNAVRNGKKVYVFFELQARFDEENNLYWANRMKENGATVLVGTQYLKVHSKLILIERTWRKKNQLIAYVGTGNFNEKSSRIYTDLGLLTKNIEITSEVKKVFQLLENSNRISAFKTLMVSPINTRSKIIKLIDEEIHNAKKGLATGIKIKMNNLVDGDLIEKLYEASRVGVKIQCIIRGICCLRAGVEGLSENIEIISIVDRFLEHSRFFIFQNNNDPVYYISSADWMERNLDKRIEVGCPIFDKSLKKDILKIFECHWQDNQKSRIIDADQQNQYVDFDESMAPFRSQTELFEMYKMRSENVKFPSLKSEILPDVNSTKDLGLN